MHKSHAILLIAEFVSIYIVESHGAHERKSPISFKDGMVNVDVRGYHAAAGRNRLNAGAGLHLEVGTPLGLRASAGILSSIRNHGLSGQLYANAGNGKNINAKAGLGGMISAGAGGPMASGSLYSDASFGAAKAGAGLGGTVTVGHTPSASGGLYSGASFSSAKAAAGLGGTVAGGKTPIASGGLYSGASFGSASAGAGLGGTVAGGQEPLAVGGMIKAASIGSASAAAGLGGAVVAKEVPKTAGGVYRVNGAEGEAISRSFTNDPKPLFYAARENILDRIEPNEDVVSDE